MPTQESRQKPPPSPRANVSNEGVRAFRADDPEAAQAVIAALLSGGVAVFPTDTVYGIAAHPDFPEALERIYAIKGRRPDKPIAFLAADAAAPGRLGFAMPPLARTLAERFWPGALTLVLDGPSCAEGFRVPDSALARGIVAASGGLLRVTSANFSGEPAALDFPDIPVDFLARCDAAINGGRCPGGRASAVVRVARDGSAEILREGDPEIARVAKAAAMRCANGGRVV